VSQEFAWQFYVGLAAVAAERRGSSWFGATPETVTRVAARTERVTDLTAALARWDDDGGAARSQSKPKRG
jgi:hypothetical protein